MEGWTTKRGVLDSLRRGRRKGEIRLRLKRIRRYTARIEKGALGQSVRNGYGVSDTVGEGGTVSGRDLRAIPLS